MRDLPSANGLPRWWQDAVALRRDLHMHPELRFMEKRTAGVLAERLEEFGYAVQTEVAQTGVVASLRRGQGPHVVLRADMDALPLTEQGDHEYRSQNDGVMHACGHDVHMAVVTAAAGLLSEDTSWSGTMSILMQPAEEVPFGEESGARAMIESEVIDFTGATFLGLHCWPWLPVGAIGIDPTVAMASKDAFRIVTRGATTHAASPVDGRDAILAMSDLVSTLHGLIFRRIDPADRVAFNIGTVDAKFGQSIMADRAETIGTIRTLDTDVRRRLIDTVERATMGISMAHDCEATVEWANQMPPVNNAPELVKSATSLLPDLEGIELSTLTDPPMTTDDFALYAEKAPGLYLKLGTGSADPVTPLHNASFDVDERSIWIGARAIVKLARNGNRS